MRIARALGVSGARSTCRERITPRRSDADCVNNLAADPQYQSQVKAMREKLFSRLRQQGDPRLEGTGDVFDNYPTSNTAPWPTPLPQP